VESIRPMQYAILFNALQLILAPMPQRGEARWGAVQQAAGRGETAVPAVPPSNLPPLAYKGRFFDKVTWLSS
jgi:hypothetical protein